MGDSTRSLLDFGSFGSELRNDIIVGSIYQRAPALKSTSL